MPLVQIEQKISDKENCFLSENGTQEILKILEPNTLVKIIFWNF